MATVDLDWGALDDSLSATLLELLNKHLVTATRPNFIGPITVHGFQFGTQAPEVEVVDIRDIFVDFLEDDEDDNDDNEGSGVDLGKVRDSGLPGADEGRPGVGHENPFDWSRRPSGMQDPGMHGSGFLPPRSPRPWGSPDVRTPSSSLAPGGHPLDDAASAHDDGVDSNPPVPDDRQSPPPTHRSSQPHPDLQLHLHVTHHSNLRVVLSTSLLINYPSPAFMSLPVKLSIVGIEFSAEVLVAYEGSRRRVHLCVLDDQDPTGLPRTRSFASSDVEPDPTIPPPSAKPLPAGLRILPTIVIESEIGQADKHVLKNVSKVERFVQDSIRKVLEDELVYPNFLTVVLAGVK
ncbi:Mitochondrial distribution and morphology protein 12 [Tulasnella sp. JGI-2019a]|nr:Mitochondrial distribution and morphology protein 12 [Tulasnella sp. JGI-2019a]